MSGGTIRGLIAAAALCAPALVCAPATAFAQAPPPDPIGDLLKPTPSEAEAYDARLKASAAAAESFQGPLNGGWTLIVDGHPRYALQLVDRPGALEGAWRDLDRPGAISASGFIDELVREDGALTVRFAGATAVLHPTGPRWTGPLTTAGKTSPAVLSRRP